MIKLSIIIPIYKVEEYIIECIESVCCQLVESVEVILVNDGTPDRSMVIAKEYINEKYSQYLKQFIFIDQKNQGLSGARNTGLSVSTGKYITFLDSDDKLQENYFNKILNIILINDVDVIQFSALRFDNDGNYSSFLKKSVAAGFCEMNEENLVLIFEDSSWFIWLRVYKKELFHNNLFPIGRNYEDAFLVPMLILESCSIYYLDEVLIFYRLNMKGITFSKNQKNIEDCQYVLEDMIDKSKKNSLYKYTVFNFLVYFLELSLMTEGFLKSKAKWHKVKVKLKGLRSYKLSLKQQMIYFLGIYYVCFKRLYWWLKK